MDAVEMSRLADLTNENGAQFYDPQFNCNCYAMAMEIYLSEQSVTEIFSLTVMDISSGLMLGDILFVIDPQTGVVSQPVIGVNSDATIAAISKIMTDEYSNTHELNITVYPSSLLNFDYGTGVPNNLLEEALSRADAAAGAVPALEEFISESP